MGIIDGTTPGLPAGYRLHEFEIIRVAGVGGFSIVYLALDHQLHRQVALKEYFPGTLAARGAEQHVTVVSERERDTFRLGLGSFVNEARLLASFDHPSLVKVYRFWEQNGTAYMVMPYYAAPTLKAVLQARQAGGGPPDEAWLKRLLAPLLDALQTLHANHCYHRDISPDNILMLGDPPATPLLLDFGAARRVIGNASQALTAILKPGFAPIEQYVETASSMRQGAWTDVYAVCAVLYTAISGRIPIASVARVMDDELEPVSEFARGRYSAAFLSAIDHGLTVRPEGRPQDVATLRAALFAEAPIAAAPVRTSTRTAAQTVAPPTAMPPRPAAWRRAIWAAPATAVVVAGLGWAWRAWTPSPAPAVADDSSSAASAPAVAPATASTATQGARDEFSVAAALDDIVRAADPALTVIAIAERDRVRIGLDDIRLKVKANQDGYLYVLFSGTAEPEIRLLYPNRRDSDPRIAAHAEVTLPTPASKLRMTASGPPGVDRIVAIVSRAPRNFDALGLRSASSAAFDLPAFDLARAAELWSAAAAPQSPYAGAAACAASIPCAPGYGATLVEISEIAASTMPPPGR